MRKKTIKTTIIATLAVSTLAIPVSASEMSGFFSRSEIVSEEATCIKSDPELITSENGTVYIRLDRAIPLDDIAFCYTDSLGYPTFELADVGNQLDDKANRSYADIMNEIWSHYVRVLEDKYGVLAEAEDYSFYISKGTD